MYSPYIELTFVNQYVANWRTPQSKSHFDEGFQEYLGE